MLHSEIYFIKRLVLVWVAQSRLDDDVRRTRQSQGTPRYLRACFKPSDMDEDIDSWSEISSLLSLFDFFLFFFFFFLEGPSSGPSSRLFRLLGPGTGEDDLWEHKGRLSNTLDIGHA